MAHCIFCKTSIDKIVESKYFYAIYDIYPVTKGHSLIISKEHKSNYLYLSDAEKLDLIDITDLTINILSSRFKTDNFNIGINIGINSGQTIDHFHQHIIPRYKDDVDDPTGGVRGVIPNKQKY